MQELLHYMRRMRQDGSTENMTAVLRAAAGNTFTVPVNDGSFHAVTDTKGNRYMVVYSDRESFEKLSKDPDQNTAEAPFEEILDIAVDGKLGLSGIVINPGGEEVIFGKELLGDIAEQMGLTEQSLRVGEPDHYPEHLLDKISEFGAGEDKVREIYVRLFVNGKTEQTGWIFIISCEGEQNEREYLFDTFKRFIDPYLDTLPSIVVDKETEYGAAAVGGVRPVYGGDA